MMLPFDDVGEPEIDVSLGPEFQGELASPIQPSVPLEPT